MKNQVNQSQELSRSAVVISKDKLSDADLRCMVRKLNLLFGEIQRYKETHREQRIGYYNASIGSIVNAYREGDLNFEETIEAIKAASKREAGK